MGVLKRREHALQKLSQWLIRSHQCLPTRSTTRNRVRSSCPSPSPSPPLTATSPLLSLLPRGCVCVCVCVCASPSPCLLALLFSCQIHSLTHVPCLIHCLSVLALLLQGDHSMPRELSALPACLGPTSPEHGQVAGRPRTNTSTPDWGGSHAWLRSVFSILEDDPRQLANIRLVCSNWASQAAGLPAQLSVTIQSRKHAKSLGCGLLATRASPHTLYLRVVERNGCMMLPAMNRLGPWLFTLSGRLTSLHIKVLGLTKKNLSVLWPVLPGLQSLSISTSSYAHETQVTTQEMDEMLSCLTNLTSLDFSQFRSSVGTIGSDGRKFYGPPVRGLAALPAGLARLEIGDVDFGAANLDDLPFVPSLTHLTMKYCCINGRAGLIRAANLRRLCIKGTLLADDLHDIVSLQYLTELSLALNERIPPGFTQQLAARIPGLTSLSLFGVLTEETLAPLGTLSNLTSLKLVGGSAGPDLAPLSGDSFRHLTSLRRLAALELSQFMAPDFLAGCGCHLQAMVGLRSLELVAITHPINAPLSTLLPRQLEHLALIHHGTLSATGRFCSMPVTTWISAILMQLPEACPSLTSLNLTSNYGLLDYSDEARRALAYLAQLPCLEKLHIEQDVICQSEGFTMFKKCLKKCSNILPLLGLLKKLDVKRLGFGERHKAEPQLWPPVQKPPPDYSELDGPLSSFVSLASDYLAESRMLAKNAPN